MAAQPTQTVHRWPFKASANEKQTQPTAVNTENVPAKAETVIEQAQHMAKDALNFAASSLHAGKEKAADMAEGTTLRWYFVLNTVKLIAQANSDKTLKNVIDDGRNTVANAIGAAKDYLQGDKTATLPQTGETAYLPGNKTLLERSREAVTAALSQAQSALATGVTRAEDLMVRADASGTQAANDASAKLQQTFPNATQKATEASNSLGNAVDNAADKLVDAAQRSNVNTQTASPTV